MVSTIILRGAYIITDPRLGPAGVIPKGSVAITDGTVAQTGPFAEIAPKYPGARVLGDGRQLVMPGLVDAHSHGRGLSPIQKGVRNDFLENALFDWAYMPVLPPELTAAVCAWRHLQISRRHDILSPRFWRPESDTRAASSHPQSVAIYGQIARGVNRHQATEKAGWIGRE